MIKLKQTRYATVGPNSKNPPKIRFLNNVTLTGYPLMPATFRQIFDMMRMQ